MQLTSFCPGRFYPQKSHQEEGEVEVQFKIVFNKVHLVAHVIAIIKLLIRLQAQVYPSPFVRLQYRQWRQTFRSALTLPLLPEFAHWYPSGC